MSEQPTIADAEDNAPKLHQIHLLKSHIDALKAENLAQGEDLAAECIRYGKLAQLHRQQGEDMVDVLKQRDELKAENQELKTLLTQERHDHNLEVEAYQEQLMNVTQGGMAQLKAREIEIEALKSSSYRVDQQDGE